ncbi:alpha/beta fold hydrolase [Pelosinus sp. IPA-1]|uniref:alpha/beta hydrolase family protein n=1 Tax=Pelosinus sp. IPA-1 TaxID=3029569 RepID=UPI0024362B19|nr:alpha/beta fold hydrolase [Pelosinus sp. IPA-1]GMA97723.1 dipeptidyl aminopeptidase [Pelosinus sp. IPA-1]
MTEIRKTPRAQSFNRMMAHGLDHTDYTKMIKRIANGEDHVNVCEELGDKSFAYAEEELKKGHKDAARIFFMKAVALYRIGEYDLTYLTEEKLRIYKKILDGFSKGIQLYNNMTVERVELPYKNSIMCGWMFIPNHAPKDVPVIIVMGGLTGFKEEANSMAMVLVDRGFAVLLIDGPGQGESLYFHKCYLEVDHQDAHNIMIDYIINRSDVGNKVGIYGISFGGYLVARTAGYLSYKLAACVSRGGGYEVKDCLVIPNYLEKFTMRFGKDKKDKDFVETNLIEKMSLKGIADKITCPLLIIHNDEDPTFNVELVKKTFAEAASTDKTFKLFSDRDHCANTDDTEARTYVVDWLADRLLA